MPSSMMALLLLILHVGVAHCSWTHHATSVEMKITKDARMVETNKIPMSAAQNSHAIEMLKQFTESGRAEQERSCSQPLVVNLEEAKYIQKLWDSLEIPGRPSLTDTFEVEQIIGSGARGFVARARNRRSHLQVALKCSPDTQIDHINAQWYFSDYFRRHHVSGVALVEEQAYAATRDEAHTVFGQFLDQLTNVSTALHHAWPLEAKGYVCLVDQFMPLGNLEQQQNVSTEMAFKWLKVLATTVAGMHENHVRHGDLKAANSMLQKQNTTTRDAVVSPVLIDLGCARNSDDPAGFEIDIHMFRDLIGNTRWKLCPELLNGVDPLRTFMRRGLGLTQRTTAPNNLQACKSLHRIWWKIMKGTVSRMSDIAQEIAHASRQLFD